MVLPGSEHSSLTPADHAARTGFSMRLGCEYAGECAAGLPLCLTLRGGMSTVATVAACGGPVAWRADAPPTTRTRSAMPASFDPRDPLGIDDLLSPEDLAIRDTVRAWCAERVLPHVAEWFEAGELPAVRELARELGQIGALGMHLEGYGCAGASAVHYGLACVELEAADSGLRSLVSVQGSLAMYAIHRWGSAEQKERWLPAMAAGEVIGCFGLTEPDHGSDPASMRTSAKRDGGDWVLSGRKMWITNGSVAGVAIVWAQTEDGIRGFVVPADAPGFSAPEIKHKGSLRASVTSELVLDSVRLPADAALPE